mmetsp:Transcript_33275/g.97002  ORF Transcript_33275/g.97002 Transcript_33275/m.97002 type:complete len:288 (-) Transcript_33275:120-983(-)
MPASAAKLPSHLTSLLRHRQVDSCSEAVAGGRKEGVESGLNDLATAGGGTRAAKKRAARQKRRAKEAAARAATREEARASRLEARRKARVAAAAAATEGESIVADATSAQSTEQEVAASSGKHVKKTRAKNVRLDNEARRPPAKRRKKREELRKREQQGMPGGLAELFDPAGAERDAALMRQAEEELGLSRDPAQRRKAEAAIFADLGFEDAEGVGEEPPTSSDEAVGDLDAGGKRPSTPRAELARRRRAALSSSFTDLLQGILHSENGAENTVPRAMRKFKGNARR